MQNTGKLPPYTCRRCNTTPEFWSYNTLRAHLRSVHGVNHLPNDDLVLYETISGSRQHDTSVFNPNLSPITSPVQRRALQPKQQINEQVVKTLTDIRACAQSIAERNVEFQVSLQNSLLKAIQESVQTVAHDFLKQKASESNLLLLKLAKQSQQTGVPINLAAASSSSTKHSKMVNMMGGKNPDIISEAPKFSSDDKHIEKMTGKSQSSHTIGMQNTHQEGESIGFVSQLEPSSSDEELLKVILPEEEVSVDEIRAQLQAEDIVSKQQTSATKLLSNSLKPNIHTNNSHSVTEYTCQP